MSNTYLYSQDQSLLNEPLSSEQYSNVRYRIPGTVSFILQHYYHTLLQYYITIAQFLYAFSILLPVFDILLTLGMDSQFTYIYCFTIGYYQSRLFRTSTYLHKQPVHLYLAFFLHFQHYDRPLLVQIIYSLRNIFFSFLSHPNVKYIPFSLFTLNLFRHLGDNLTSILACPRQSCVSGSGFGIHLSCLTVVYRAQQVNFMCIYNQSQICLAASIGLQHIGHPHNKRSLYLEL